MDFPRERYARVGATPDELADLEATFTKFSPAAQQSLLDTIAPMSDTGVLALLDYYRAHNASLPDAEPEPEPEPTPAPASSSGKQSAPDPAPDSE